MLSVLSLFPLYWTVITSFKEKGHIFVFPPEWLPNPVTLDGYNNLFTQIPFFVQPDEHIDCMFGGSGWPAIVQFDGGVCICTAKIPRT